MDVAVDNGIVLRIEKTSIHDGEGLRTVVFLKGCPLRCKWCSTPESQKKAIECGYGKRISAKAVIHEITKDAIFFFHSGGGVTVSGGEVLAQADFTAEILKGCLEEGISTAVETSLFSDFSEIKKLLPYLQSMYIDFKLFDEDSHRFYTGVSNQRIKENLIHTDAVFKGDIHIRIPTIPGVNMTVENMEKTAAFISKLEHVRDVELLPYHRLGLETYRKMNREYELKNTEPPSMEELQSMAEVFLRVNPQMPVKIKGKPVKPILLTK